MDSGPLGRFHGSVYPMFWGINGPQSLALSTQTPSWRVPKDGLDQFQDCGHVAMGHSNGHDAMVTEVLWSSVDDTNLVVNWCKLYPSIFYCIEQHLDPGMANAPSLFWVPSLVPRGHSHTAIHRTRRAIGCVLYMLYVCISVYIYMVPCPVFPPPPHGMGGGVWCPCGGVYTYIHTYIPTYLPTYIPTYIHTYHYITLPYITLPYITLPYIPYIHTYHYITLPYITLPYITLPYIPYIHTYTDTHTHTYIHRHTHIHTYIHTNIPTYQHTNIPTYQHTSIPTYQHTTTTGHRGGDQKNHTTTTGHGGGGDQKNHTTTTGHRGGGTRRTRRYCPPIPIGGGGGGVANAAPYIYIVYIYNSPPTVDV